MNSSDDADEKQKTVNETVRNIDDVDIQIHRHVRRSSADSNSCGMTLKRIDENNDSIININGALLNRSNSLIVEPPSESSDESRKWNFKNGVSRSLLVFVMRAIISLIVIIFCIVQISTHYKENNTLYFTILSTTTAIWSPSPFEARHKDKK